MEGERGSAKATPVLSEWLGYWVFISYMSGPNLDQNQPTPHVSTSLVAPLHVDYSAYPFPPLLNKT